MQICKAVDTPLFLADKLSLTDGEEYITYSRPDIAFSVNKICQFLHAPMIVHWTAGIFVVLSHLGCA
jgi:hypothetical protein